MDENRRLVWNAEARWVAQRLGGDAANYGVAQIDRSARCLFLDREALAHGAGAVREPPWEPQDTAEVTAVHQAASRASFTAGHAERIGAIRFEFEARAGEVVLTEGIPEAHRSEGIFVASASRLPGHLLAGRPPPGERWVLVAQCLAEALHEDAWSTLVGEHALPDEELGPWRGEDHTPGGTAFVRYDFESRTKHVHTFVREVRLKPCAGTVLTVDWGRDDVPRRKNRT